MSALCYRPDIPDHGDFIPQGTFGNTCKHLSQCGVGRGKLLASGGWRPEMLLIGLRCTGRPTSGSRPPRDAHSVEAETPHHKKCFPLNQNSQFPKLAPRFSPADFRWAMEMYGPELQFLGKKSSTKVTIWSVILKTQN